MATSRLVQESFQNLRVRQFFLTVAQVARTESTRLPLVPLIFLSHPHQLDLSYPPRNRHKQYYGFWLDHQWLIDLGKNVRNPEDRIEPPSENDFWLRGLGEICGAVKINSLTIEMCFQPEQNGAPPEHVDANGRVFVLSVCSDDEADYPVIPSQEQVDYLANLLGRQPRWWVSIWSRIERNQSMQNLRVAQLALAYPP
ncbi:hypothetical protein EDB19DRAFT_2026030, partial [Suillus lakei]